MITDRRQFSFKGDVLIEKVTFSPPFRYPAIFADEGCFLYITGTTNAAVNAPQEQLKLSGKEAVLLKCGTYLVHFPEEGATSEVCVYAIHLYPAILKNIYNTSLPSFAQPEHRKNNLQKIAPDNIIARFIEGIDFYFEHPALVNDELLELKIKELILLLVQTKNAASVYQLIDDLFTPRNITLRNVIDTHIYSDLTIEELAHLCNMSLSTFKREFSQAYNDSPAQYINKKRLEKAKSLLITTAMSIQEVAFEAGFNDASYFTRVFKQTYGATPSDMRS